LCAEGERLCTIWLVHSLLSFDPDVFYSPRYVQRLAAPTTSINRVAFGGDGGRNDWIIERCLGVWEFEYMGASEYEHGAAGAALERIATGMAIGTYDAWTFPLSVRANKRLGLVAHDEPVAIHVIGRMAHRFNIEKTISEWVTWPVREYIQVKGPAYVSEAIRAGVAEVGSEGHRTRGWLELTNGFLFFADEQMYLRALSRLRRV